MRRAEMRADDEQRVDAELVDLNGADVFTLPNRVTPTLLLKPQHGRCADIKMHRFLRKPWRGFRIRMEIETLSTCSSQSSYESHPAGQVALSHNLSTPGRIVS